MVKIARQSEKQGEAIHALLKVTTIFVLQINNIFVVEHYSTVLRSMAETLIL
jgi:hypothetical protein